MANAPFCELGGLLASRDDRERFGPDLALVRPALGSPC